jgi:hypothetical protein
VKKKMLMMMELEKNRKDYNGMSDAMRVSRQDINEKW